MTASSEEATYLADHWTLEDALSFSDFRPALENILKTAETPLTAGIFGPWGSGKTSLMRMLRDQFEAEGVASVRTVWFTAWKYDRHEVLWRAFILRVLDALYPREDKPEGLPREDRPILENPNEEQHKLITLLERLEESVYQAVDWEEIGRRAVNWWQFIGHTGKAGVETAAIFSTGGIYALGKKLAGGDDTPVDDVKKAAKAISHETRAYHRRQLFHMEEFEATFKEAIKLIPEGRLVIFVDDLDRCLPEKAIEVLEAIKLFLEVPGTVFVLGMDQDVIQRGVEARYGSLFRRELGDRSELPIRGDVYLQKIVQIPFYLPAMAVTDLEQFIEKLDKRLPELARQVFARGLFPNPRTVKRALNIFRLLQQIALAREAQGGLPKEAIAWPLLAKTIVIQTQFPGLYQRWRQYPTLIQTLEAEYSHRQWTEEDTLLGRVKSRPAATIEGEEPAAAEKEPAERTGGLLAPYLENEPQYALLVQMLAFPPADRAGEGRNRARFEELSRGQVAAYVRLAGVAETEEMPPIDIPVDLLEEMLSGDRARVQDAVARLDEQEEGKEGSLHRAFRQRLLEVMNSSQQPARVRVSAGDALALLGDPRFRADAWFLPDESLLGFVEIPAGPFLMGSDKERDSLADEDELPQHELSLPAYYIARYPVTVAQFRAFVEDSGHKPIDEDSLRGPDNHPVVSVSWHDAIAYCDWLTSHLRRWSETPEPLRTLLRQGENDGSPWRVILPSEAEWEKAARGSNGRIYPWGNEFDPQKANLAATGIGVTSAIGCFPVGASPYGLMDVSGNVWEWTRSLWGESEEKSDFKYPYQPGDGREDLKAPDSVGRVLRGGSFLSKQKLARAAVRGWGLNPDLLWLDGLRLAVSTFL